MLSIKRITQRPIDRKMTNKEKKRKLEKIVSIKKRILRESCNLKANYKTTYKDIKKYFNIFNKALFKDELNPFNDVQIKRMNGCWGQCVEDYSIRKGTRFLFLEIIQFMKIKKNFLLH